MTKRDLTSAATEVAARIGCAAAQRAWVGPDPYDGLWWPGWPDVLLRRRRARQVIIQLHARSPVDFRPLYRRDDPVNAKTLALFGAAGWRLPGVDAHTWALEALERLVRDRSAGPEAWGYPFPVQTRWSFYPAATPNIIATSFAARALGEAAAPLESSVFAARAEAAAHWVLDKLFDHDLGFFTYHPQSSAPIHNANLLGARVVHDLVSGPASDAVRRAVSFTLAAQRADGSFPYGNGPGLAWVDSFHTGYVLDALLGLRAVDPRIDEALIRGATFYVTSFFGDRGEARLWPNRPYPEDGHSAGTGSGVVARLADAGLTPWATADRIAERTARRMVHGDHAVHRRWRRGRSRVEYVRWCDGHVAHGLAIYAALRN